MTKLFEAVIRTQTLLSFLYDLSWCLETISTAAISSTSRHLLGKFKLWKPNEILDVDGEVFSLAQ